MLLYLCLHVQSVRVAQ